MTLIDKDGRAWKPVPVEATAEMCQAMYSWTDLVDAAIRGGGWSDEELKKKELQEFGVCHTASIEAAPDFQPGEGLVAETVSVLEKSTPLTTYDVLARAILTALFGGKHE